MDLFELETFVTVVQEHSFSRAATKLHRTQSAVSQAIRRLENSLGEPLLDRSSREGLLTDAGRVLHGYAQKLLNLRNEANRSLRELREMHHGRLVLAANELTLPYLLLVLHEFRQVCPMIKINVQRSLRSTIPEDVLNHAAEIGIVSSSPDKQLDSIVVYRDELAFIVNPKHPLATAASVSIRQLGAESFIVHAGQSSCRQKISRAFEQHKTPFHMNIELPSIETIKAFVVLGNGVALVPAICMSGELARGELVRVKVPELCIERRLRIVYRRNATLSHAARAFLNVARSIAERENGRCLYNPER